MRFSGYNRYQCFCSAVASLLLCFAVGAALTRADDVDSDAGGGGASRFVSSLARKSQQQVKFLKYN